MPIKNLKEKMKALHQKGVKIIEAKRGTVVQQEEEDEESKWIDWTVLKLQDGKGFKGEQTEAVLRVAYSKLLAYKLEPEVAARVICALFLASKEEV